MLELTFSLWILAKMTGLLLVFIPDWLPKYLMPSIMLEFPATLLRETEIKPKPCKSWEHLTSCGVSEAIFFSNFAFALLTPAKLFW